jgi:hypothetical protein
VNLGFPELARSKSTSSGSSFRSGSTEYKAACSTPTAASGPHKKAVLGEKKPGTPVSRVVSWFAAFPNIGPDGHVGRLSIRDQNSRSRFNRDLTSFPAMIDPLMAPIEVPITQSGSIPASWSAS